MKLSAKMLAMALAVFVFPEIVVDRAHADPVRVEDLPDAALFDRDTRSALFTALSDAFDPPIDESDAVLRPRARLRIPGPPDRVLIAYSFSNETANPTGRSIPPIGLAVYQIDDDKGPEGGFTRIDDWTLTPTDGGIPHGIDSVRLIATPDGAVLRLAGPSLSISLDDQSLSRGQTLIPLSAAGLPAGPGITVPAEARLTPGGILGDDALPDGEAPPPILTLSVVPGMATANDGLWPAIMIATDPSGLLPDEWQGSKAIPIDIDPSTGALSAPDGEARLALARLSQSIGPDVMDRAGLVLPDLLQRGEAIAMIGAPDRRTGILNRIGPRPAPQDTETPQDIADPQDIEDPHDTQAEPPAVARIEPTISPYQPPRQHAVCERLRWNGATVAAHILGEGRLTNWLARITHVAAADPMGRVRVTMNLCPGSARTIAVPVEIPAADAARLLTGSRVGLTRLTGVPTARQASPGVGIRALSATVPTS